MELTRDKKYLFVCAYGQSRSVYFAEQMIKNGYIAAFCGHQPEADFVLTNGICQNWADVIILLDKEILRDNDKMSIIEQLGKQIIENYILDENFGQLEHDFEEFFIEYIDWPYRKAIKNTNTMNELIDVIKKYGSIEGSHRIYSPEELVDFLEDVIMNDCTPNILTRSLGLRDKALEIKNNTCK